MYDDVDVDEMKTFIGILILMGILRLPRLRCIEARKYISTPGISTLLTKTQIFRFLHVANNAAITTTPDKLDH